MGAEETNVEEVDKEGGRAKYRLDLSKSYRSSFAELSLNTTWWCSVAVLSGSMAG